MKKIIIGISIILLLVGLVLASSLNLLMVREVPDNVPAGETFSIEHVVTGSSGNYGVLYLIDVTGGCTGVGGRIHLAGGFIHSQDTTSSIIFNAPSSPGECTFTGDYQFADASGAYSIIDFPSQTVIIGESVEPIILYSNDIAYSCVPVI